MTWTPILDGCQRDRALEVVTGIADTLLQRFSLNACVRADEAWSAAEGRSGVALFFAYYGRALRKPDALAVAARLVEEAFEAATGVATTYHLFGGLAGVAWTLAHVDGWLLDLSDGDPDDEIDAALLDLLATTWSGGFDVVSGLTGVGVYALERLPRPGAMQLLSGVVSRLTEYESRYPFWWSPPVDLPPALQRTFPDGAWNLGFAHGVPGVIALLAKAHAAGVSAAGPLLERGMQWLLAQRLPREAGSTFDSLVAPEVAPRRSRLAWCYGDPGIAAALSVAAQHVHKSDWQGIAIEVAQRAAARTRADSDVTEPSICHGSSGVAHIFNRLHQASASSVLRDAAQRWLLDLLDAELPRHAPSGFLSGLSGIGLVLLAATTPIEPAWDRLLLLS